MSVAILVDAAFFIKRFPAIYPKLDKGNPEVVGKTLYSMCMEHVKQKGVDMRIGLDFASLSLKGMIEQIILISGNGEFVLAAKLAPIFSFSDKIRETLYDNEG